ncbi:hypothetical protein AWQ21_10995 [Picosynechococcus sp. PCC 7003]|nr:hypothetical protein AWQ21_10995 [Picosynechococcus sp. PCC 7003]
MIRKLASPLVIAGLMVTGNFQLIPQALAVGTAAGTTINNTATATYEDPAGNTQTTESNTVSVTVAPIAGLTNVPAEFIDDDGEAAEDGDVLRYIFKITNIGNTDAGLILPAPTLENLERVDDTADPTNTAAAELLKIYADAERTQLIGYYDPATGDLTSDGTTANSIDVTVNADGTFTSAAAAGSEGVLLLSNDAEVYVEVVTTPVAGAEADDDLRVTLGDTPPNDNTAATQDQPWDNTDPGDVRTDHTVTGATPTPTNGEREAAATFFVDFASAPSDVPLIRLQKEESAYDNGNTDTDVTDDTITYELTLNVDPVNPPPSGQAAGDLFGTEILYDNAAGDSDTAHSGTTAQAILISDAIPDGTELTALPTAPTGWRVVYTFDDPSTVAATNAEWYDEGVAFGSTNTVGTVTRIGFVYTGSSNDGTLNGFDADSTEFLPAGSVESGFSFTVRVNDAAVREVYNLAEAFGADENNITTYDQSGDNNPNNYDDGTFPDGDPYGDYDPAEDFGVYEEGVTGIDENGNNTGQGPDGEAVETILTVAPPVDEDLGILNGPDGFPGATGPDGSTNTDLQEESYAVCPVATANSVDDAVVYTNTISNTTANASLNNVTVEPITDIDLDGTPDISVGDLPTNSVVTIVGNREGTTTATLEYAQYTYNGTVFNLVSSGTISGTTLTPEASPFRPLNLGDLPATNPDSTFNYTVYVQFPDSTACANNVATDSFEVPLLAFTDDFNGTTGTGFLGYGTDDNGDGTQDGVETTKNLTFDVILGTFVELVKEARILNPDGTPRTSYSQDLSGVQLFPGEIIEYRVTYRNLATNLDASDFAVFEDGTDSTNVAPLGADGVNDATQGGGDDNNWALDNDGNGEPDTVHWRGTTFESGTEVYYYPVIAGSNLATYDPTSGTFDPSGDVGTSSVTSDPANGTPIEAYVNFVGNLNAGESGAFTFRRQLQ